MSFFKQLRETPSRTIIWELIPHLWCFGKEGLAPFCYMQLLAQIIWNNSSNGMMWENSTLNSKQKYIGSQ